VSNSRPHGRHAIGKPYVGLLLVGLVLLAATSFIITFFHRLPQNDPNRSFLMAVFGVPYAFLLLCAVIIFVVCVARRKPKPDSHH
jgi:hypothetical protein